MWRPCYRKISRASNSSRCLRLPFPPRTYWTGWPLSTIRPASFITHGTGPRRTTRILSIDNVQKMINSFSVPPSLPCRTYKQKTGISPGDIMFLRRITRRWRPTRSKWSSREKIAKKSLPWLREPRRLTWITNTYCFTKSIPAYIPQTPLISKSLPVSFRNTRSIS